MSLYDFDMSLFDSSYLEARFTPTSESHPAPACMDHPAAGRFHLSNVILFEKHQGPSRAREHQHRVYHLLIFCEGKNEFRVNGRNIRSVRGTCVLSEPKDTHHFLPLKPGTTVYHAVTLTYDPMRIPPPWAELLTYYTGRPLESIPPVFTIPETAMLKLPPILAELRGAISSHEPASIQRIHFGVLQMFAFMAEAISEQQQPHPARPQAPEINAHEFLDTHYAGRLSLDEVAQRSGISAEHLSRAFKRRYGITPSRYRDALRMDAANNLLRHSDLLIKEIAYRLGYPDPFTFSKAFHRHYHCSPGSTRLAIPKGQC